MDEMVHRAKRILALAACTALSALAAGAPGARAQVLYPTNSYSGFGQGVTSGYTNYGVAAPVQSGGIAPTPYGLNLSPSIGLGGGQLAPYGSSVTSTYGSPTAANGQQSVSPNTQNNPNSIASSPGAPAAALPPAAGSEAAKKQEAKDAAAAHPAGTSSQAPRALQVGDTLHGSPRAVTGDTLSFGTGTVKLSGVRAPDLGALCRAGLTVWRCGQDSRDALQRLADLRPVTCIITRTGGTAEASCASGRESMDKLVLEEGAAFPVGLSAPGLGGAKADGRGIWAGQVRR